MKGRHVPPFLRLFLSHIFEVSGLSVFTPAISASSNTVYPCSLGELPFLTLAYSITISPGLL